MVAGKLTFLPATASTFLSCSFASALLRLMSLFSSAFLSSFSLRRRSFLYQEPKFRKENHSALTPTHSSSRCFFLFSLFFRNDPGHELKARFSRGTLPQLPTFYISCMGKNLGSTFLFITEVVQSFKLILLLQLFLIEFIRFIFPKE